MTTTATGLLCWRDFHPQYLTLKLSCRYYRRERKSGAPNVEREIWGTDLGNSTLGIGAIIGAGIFVLTGHAAAANAGPAITLSFALGAVACAFAGLCYAEMASTVPVAGSAYTYAYATMGEFIAWIIGWDLILEYALGATTVAIGWSVVLPLPPSRWCSPSLSARGRMSWR
jgi:amino acid permease